MTKAQFIRRRDALNKKRLKYENELIALEGEYIKENSVLIEGAIFECDGLQYKTTGHIILDADAILLYELDWRGEFTTFRSFEERGAEK